MNLRFFRLPIASAVTAVLVGLCTTALAGNIVSGSHAVVAGGDQNTASGPYSAVGGGFGNIASGLQSAVAGGYMNTAGAQSATVGGGMVNTARGVEATVAGGGSNTATGESSSIGGGEANSALGYASTVAGGAQNQAGGNYSFAAGGSAHIRTAAEAGFPNDQNQEHADSGTFMWADSTGNTPPFTVPGQFTSSGPNEFLVRANGGFALNGTPVNSNVAMTVISPISNPGYASVFLRQSNGVNGVLISSGDAAIGRSTANNAAFYIDQYNGSSQTRRMSLDQSGNLSVSAQAYKPGGGAWAASSDARLKTNVQPLDHALDRLLALRGVTFEYAHPDKGLRPPGTFTGFIAQEVEPKFPDWIGHDDKGYLTVGPQGFEALTVEALRSLKVDADARMTKLEKENADLRVQLADQMKIERAELAELRQQMAPLTFSTAGQIAAAPGSAGNPDRASNSVGTEN